MWSLEKALKVNVVIAKVNAIIGHNVNKKIGTFSARIFFQLLTRRCRLPRRIYVSVTEGMIGPENGLPPVQRQPIIWTNIPVSSIEPLGTNFREIWIKIL